MKTTYGLLHEEEEKERQDIMNCESLGITVRAKEIIDDILCDSNLFDTTVGVSTGVSTGMSMNEKDNEKEGLRMNGLGITRSYQSVNIVVGISSFNE